MIYGSMWTRRLRDWKIAIVEFKNYYKNKWFENIANFTVIKISLIL
jgi:hypothetical protein